ncbi:MAG TPA: hypothetical protein VMT74_00330 [Gaiellaceae bacterium]|nr:hypothetical protein [Gaiellaceae bacterium]
MSVTTTTRTGRVLRTAAGFGLTETVRAAGTRGSGAGRTTCGTRSNGNDTAGTVSWGIGAAIEANPGSRSAWTTGAT